MKVGIRSKSIEGIESSVLLKELKEIVLDPSIATDIEVDDAGAEAEAEPTDDAGAEAETSYGAGVGLQTPAPTAGYRV